MAKSKTPSELALEAYYSDPVRRERIAKKALEEAVARDANPPADRTPTPSELALRDFYADPKRREEKAKKALDAAKKQEGSENAGLGTKGVKAAGAGIKSALGMVAGKFMAVAGPMAILSTVLGSTTSGFQTLSKSVQLLGAVLSPVFLPATVLIATALTAAASVLETGSSSALEPFFDLVLGLGLPAVIGFVQAVQIAAQALDGLQGAAENAADFFGLDLQSVSTGPAGFLNRNILGASQEELEEQDKRRVEGNDDISNTVTSSLRDVMASLRLSVAPKAQISGLSGISNAVQLAALNQDPLEARMLKVQERILNALERSIARMGRSGRVYDPTTGDGDYSGGTGSGGGGDYGGGDF